MERLFENAQKHVGAIRNRPRTTEGGRPYPNEQRKDEIPMLINIPVSRINPHPQNPRKNTGDITELSDSIRQRGILQNLTVVPQDADEYLKMINSKRKYTGDYTVIIGHRRLEAAKAAGLKEVPCTVATMDERTQIETMLTENIQRSDLTTLEQADGYQTLLDMGESQKQAAETTGKSTNYVHSLIKWRNTFPREALEKLQGRQIPFGHYTKLYKIEDETRRAKVFEKIGTSEFDWEYGRAIANQECERVRKEACAVLDTFASEVTRQELGVTSTKQRWEYWRWEDTVLEAVKKLAAERDTAEEYYYVAEAMQLTVYIKNQNAAVEQQQRNQKEERQRARAAELTDVFAQAYKLRLAFAAEVTVTAKNRDAVETMAVDAMTGSGCYFDKTVYATFTEGRDVPKAPLFAAAYSRMDEPKASCYAVNRGGYSKNEKLERLYSHLTALGYVMSAAERALLDGTHEAYINEQ